MATPDYQFAKRKPFRMLSTLAKDELDKARGWLALELTRKETKLLTLFDCLRNREGIEAVWAKIYPGMDLPEKPFLYGPFRSLENKLTTLLEEYISILEFREDANQRNIYLVKALNKRSQQLLFPPTYKRILKKLERAKVKDAAYFRMLFELQRVWLFYELKHPDAKKRIKLSKDWNDNFDNWWLHEKLRLGLLNLNQEQVRADVKMPTRLLDEAILLAGSESVFDLPTTRVYAQLLDLYRNENSNNLDMGGLVKGLGDHFIAKERQDLFISLLNFFIIKAFHNTESFLYERFELYRSGIEEGLLLHDGFLPSSIYTNFIVIGAKIKKLKLSWGNLEKLKEKLPERDREETYRFNEGVLYFYNSEYTESIKNLSLPFSTLHYKLGSRMYILQGNYEQGERVELEKDIRNFRDFLKDKKELNERKKQVYLNPVEMIKKLIRVNSKAEMGKLKREVEALKLLTNKSWLLEKIKEKQGW